MSSRFSGNVTVASETSVLVDFATFGFLSIVAQCCGRRECVVTVALPEEFQDYEHVEEVRRCAFIFFSVPEDTPYLINVCSPQRMTILSENSGDHVEFVST